MLKLDILAFAAHPDDVELSCSGTLLKHIAAGKKVGIVDLTRGELGTRGTAEIRDRESEAASKKMGISVRENLGLKDGLFTIEDASIIAVIEMIRKYQPEIVLANAITDRHPDHGRGSELVSRACFLSGLRKISSQTAGIQQAAWRPKAVYHYIQDRYQKPDFVVDITAFMAKKIEVIQCFSSQFFDPNSKEPQTPISTAEFMDFISARNREYGHNIGVTFGEGFTVERTIGINSFDNLI